jgi:hypothetical protein
MNQGTQCIDCNKVRCRLSTTEASLQCGALWDLPDIRLMHCSMMHMVQLVQRICLYCLLFVLLVITTRLSIVTVWL